MVEAAGTLQSILLKELLRQRHWSYRRFRKEYDKVAAQVDKELIGTCPTDSTFRRWLRGKVVRLPRADTCAVLEGMFPEYTVEELFEPHHDGDTLAESHEDPEAVSLPDTDNRPVPAWPGPSTAATADAYFEATSAVSEVEDVNRRQYLTSMAMALGAPGLMLSSSAPMRVGSADVSRYRENLLHLYALDDHYGASEELYSLTLRTLGQLTRILDTASFQPRVGNELRSLTGQFMEHAGWVACDAGRDQDARHWWLEALHAARMANDSEVELVVLVSMSLSALRNGRGQETIDLARTAKRVAQEHRPTSRLPSLLAAREALGHAHLGDGLAMRKALARACVMDDQPHEDDPPWLSFWGPADLASHVSRAAQRLGDAAMAERAARDAVEAVDAARFPRNYALYQANLAEVLIAQHNVDEAVPIVAQTAEQATAQVNSGRLTDKVQSLVRDLHFRHARLPEVRELVAWTAANLAPATV